MSSWAFYPSCPFLGAFVIWAPVAAYLALAGQWGSALLLTLWGTAVIGLIDNVLYPVLVGSRLMLHTVPAFIAVVGGIILFGTPGLILGPLVVTVSLVLLWIWRERLDHAAPHRLKKETVAVSLESVRAFFALHAPDVKVIELSTSTATVDLAAAAHGVSPGQIAKTLSMRIGERIVLVVARGDARLDNRKIKSTFGGKARMLPADEVEALTGHPVGGVCPFGMAAPLPVYCDVSLKAFDEVIPAAGATHSAVRIHPDRLAVLAGAAWVDVCQDVP